MKIKKKISNRSKLALAIQFLGLFLLAMNIGSNIKGGSSGGFLVPVGISLVILGLGMHITDRMKNSGKED